MPSTYLGGCLLARIAHFLFSLGLREPKLRLLLLFSPSSFAPPPPSVDCERAFCAALPELTRSFSGAEKEGGG